MKIEGWATLWVDANSKKCQICVVQMTKKPGTLFLLYTLSTQGGPTPSDNFSETGGIFCFYEQKIKEKLSAHVCLRRSLTQAGLQRNTR